MRTAADVDAMKPLEPQQVAPVAEAVSLLVSELGDVPLIGFAGAPFTLASYLVEGGPSRNHERTKAMMLGEPETWHALMTTLTDLTIAFLQTQVDAGVDAIQVFDSWAGTLSLADYRSYVLPHSTRVFAALAGAGVPMTHFGVGTAELLGAMARGRAPTVVGVDWRTSLTDAAARVGPGTALQGNLDPVVLLAGWPVVRARGARRRRGRPARGRRGRGRPRVQPRPRRAARHRPGRDHRRRGAGALAVSRVVLRCRRRDFGSGRGVPAAGGGGAGRVDHGVRPGRPARRRAAHRAGRRPGRSTSAPRRSSRAGPRCPRCWPSWAWPAGRSAPRVRGR